MRKEIQTKFAERSSEARSALAELPAVVFSSASAAHRSVLADDWFASDVDVTHLERAGRVLELTLMRETISAVALVLYKRTSALSMTCNDNGRI